MQIPREHLAETRHRAALIDLRKAINRAIGLRDLLPLIATLLEETESMVNGRALSVTDIRMIAAPFAQIRFLLAAIAPLGSDPGVDSQEVTLIRDLIERYRDLEGRIKELRNDRSPAPGPRAF